MVIGVLQVEIAIDGSHSLKEKRQTVKSVLDRARAAFNVSASEVEWLDAWQRAGLAFTTASNDAQYARGLLQKLLNTLKRHPVARVTDFTIEVF